MPVLEGTLQDRLGHPVEQVADDVADQPGAAKDRCDRRRPADQPPESYPRSARGQANDQERQAPPGPAAAPPVAEDRDG